MAYRNKTYVAFDGDTDMRAYGLMKAWKQNDHTDFNFHDAHAIKQARDSSTEETIKRSLRERMNNSKIFVLLVGQNTRYLYKYVRWEIELALSMNIPIVVVNLNQQPSHDNNLCPPILRDKLAMHISYSPKILQFTLENWETWHYVHQRNGKTGPYYYEADVYRSVGL
jgi:nicotinic acid mononucleotide adenylyltransferase